MNTFTNKSMFVTDAKTILRKSTILVKSDCMIVDDVLYEQLSDDHVKEKYRFFFDVDDYDYLCDNLELEERLDKLFASR